MPYSFVFFQYSVVLFWLLKQLHTESHKDLKDFLIERKFESLLRFISYITNKTNVRLPIIYEKMYKNQVKNLDPVPWPLTSQA